MSEVSRDDHIKLLRRVAVAMAEADPKFRNADGTPNTETVKAAMQSTLLPELVRQYLPADSS